MKVDLESSQGMGHAPKRAECTQGQEFGFNEKILQVQPNEVVTTILESDGQLPEDLAASVARNGCPQFDNGECLLRNGAVCTL